MRTILGLAILIAVEFALVSLARWRAIRHGRPFRAWPYYFVPLGVLTAIVVVVMIVGPRV